MVIVYREGEIMSITLIKGRVGRGKTKTILSQIISDVLEKKGEKYFLIVPDQMSFQTEYELLHLMPQEAMAHVEIVGFSRFVQRLVEIIDPRRLLFMDTLSQKMLLRYVVHEKYNDLNVYKKIANTTGFIEYVQQFFRQMKGSKIKTEDLMQLTTQFSEQRQLITKIEDLSIIFETYEKLLEKQALDVTDYMQYLQDLLNTYENQEKIKNFNIYIDGYYTFNHAESATLLTILKHVKQGYVTFCLPKEKQQEHSMFYQVYRQFRCFYDAFPHAKIVDINNQKGRFLNNPILDYIETHYQNPQTIAHISLPHEHVVTITQYKTIETEIHLVAQKIREKILSGVRAREIVVYIPDKKLYEPFIDKIFDLYELPYYLDIKDSMLNHPIIHWFYSCLKVLKDGWKADDVFSCIQNPFFRYQYNITEDVFFLFMNHAQSTTFKSRKEWYNEKKFYFYTKPQKIESSIDLQQTQMLLNVQSALIEELSIFERIFEGYKNHDMVLKDLYYLFEVKPLYAFIEDYQKNQSKYTSHLTEEQYHQSALKGVIKVLEQAYVTLGSLPAQKKVFLTILLYGLEDLTFASVPVGFDQIMVGDFDRSRFQTLHQENQSTDFGVQYAYILGVNEQYLPNNQPSHLFSQKELGLMQKNGALHDIFIEEQGMLYQLFRFYTLVCSAAKEIHLSYLAFGGMYQDIEQYPSLVLDTFLEKGFGFEQQFATENQFKLTYLTKNALKDAYARHLLSDHHDLMEQILFYLDPVFYETLKNAGNYQNDVFFTREIHLKNALSLTEIETYYQCPYQFFLRSYLNLKEPFTGNFETFQSGTIFHEGLATINKKVQQEKKLWKDFSIDIFHEYLNAYFNNLETKMKQHPLFLKEMNKYFFQNIKNVAQANIETLYYQEYFTTFQPFLIEQKIVYPITADFSLVGQFDRLDKTMDNHYYRIIDYKLKQKKFDFNQFLYGTQLQLPFYSLLADYYLEEKLTFAGAMYVPTYDKILSLELRDTSKYENDRAKLYQANGLFLDNKEALINFDTRLETTHVSTIIPYSINKSNEVSKDAQVFDAQEHFELKDSAKTKAIHAFTSMQQKNFAIKPIRENQDDNTKPCRFCAFKHICQFDKKINHTRDVSDKITATNFRDKKQQLFKIIKEET